MEHLQRKEIPTDTEKRKLVGFTGSWINIVNCSKRSYFTRGSDQRASLFPEMCGEKDLLKRRCSSHGLAMQTAVIEFATCVEVAA